MVLFLTRRREAAKVKEKRLLIRVGAVTFKQGIGRIVNNHNTFAPSRLRVNQKKLQVEQ